MEFTRKELIQKGWSGDKKYCVADKWGNRYLLRISDSGKYAAKQEEFRFMQKVASCRGTICLSSNALSSLYWAIPFGEGEVDVMRRQGQDILSWYDNMRNPIPSWYLQWHKEA